MGEEALALLAATKNVANEIVHVTHTGGLIIAQRDYTKGDETQWQERRKSRPICTWLLITEQ